MGSRSLQSPRCCSHASLDLPGARLEIGAGFGEILGKDPARALSQRLQAGVNAVHIDNPDRAAVSVDRMRIGLLPQDR
jgi:hypothetical protein